MTTQTGTLKWFSDKRRFGFIAPDDGSKDLFAHVRDIQGSLKSLVEHQRVRFEVTQGTRGLQASNIRAETQ